MGNRILLVDDEPAWIRTVGIFLRLSGFQVVTAGNSAQAMLQANGGDLGAIILDVNLSGEDAAELMGSLKARQPGVPVILYTGLEQEEDRVQRMMEQGAEHYLHKGNLRDLLNCLQDISRKLSFIERGPSLAPTGAWRVI